MRIFVYEFVTDGGWSATDDSLPPSGLAKEGRAMRSALVFDLEATGRVEVVSLDHRRFGDLAEEREAFQQAASRADATLVIAPEFDEILATRHRWAMAAGARVLGAGLETVELAADKQRTAEHLASLGLKVPHGVRLAAGQPLPRDFAYPAVLKPVDGAGSLGVQWIGGPDDLAVLPTGGWQDWRLERFCPGVAASIAFLCGPREVVALPACRQILARQEVGETALFEYRGGRLPLPPRLDARARRLGERVVAALQSGQNDNLGWLGIDLVLAEDVQGADDVVIEINPRLTTSYLGLRRLARDNLAAALLAVASGEPARLSFRAEPLQFAPDGCVTGRREIEGE